MVFFVLMLIALLASLAWRSMIERSAANAAYMVGAAGTLTTLAVLFYGSSYVESPSILPAWVAVGLGVAIVSGARTDPVNSTAVSPSRPFAAPPPGSPR
jgi:hypothetical protein